MMHVWIDEWERLEGALGSQIKWKDPTYISFASRIAHFTVIHVLVLPAYTVCAPALLPRDSLTMFPGSTAKNGRTSGSRRLHCAEAAIADRSLDDRNHTDCYSFR